MIKAVGCAQGWQARTARVLVLDRCRGRGKASGLETRPMRHKGAVLFHTSGGKVTRLIVYYDRERALAVLGLAPETDESNRPGSVSR